MGRGLKGSGPKLALGGRTTLETCLGSCRLPVVEGRVKDTCADGGHCKGGLAGNPPWPMDCCCPVMLRPKRLLFVKSHIS